MSGGSGAGSGHRSAVLLGIAAVFAACGGPKRSNPPAADLTDVITADLAIVDVSVVPMTREAVLEDRTVLIRNGTIASIVPSGGPVPGAGTEVVDGRGRYLIPGLADMHAHVYGEPELLLYVANGVTLLRNMWGSHTALAMRARADSGVILSPRIVTAGRLVDGESPAWGAAGSVVPDPETARAIMDEEKAAGFDFLKIYVALSAGTFDAVMAHSRETGHPVAGHVPRAVPFEDGVRSGMASIEHLTGWDRATEAYRPAGPDEAAAILRRIDDGEEDWGVLFDAERTRSLAALAAETGVWHVPTLIWMRRIYTSRRQASERFALPEMRYVSPRRRATWDPGSSPSIAELRDESLEAFQVLSEAWELRARALHEAGARILAGTDAPNPFVVPGFSIHEELEHLVAAGLSPYEALVAATRGPAEFLGRSNEGAVRAGSRADLVLLESNPLQDVSATRDIAGVVLRGRWLPQEELHGLLEALVDRYEEPDDWFAAMPSIRGSEAAVLYRTTERGRKIRAERIARPANEGLDQVTVAQRSTTSATGDRVAETLRLTSRGEGGIAELVYSQTSASGTAAVRVRWAAGGLTIEGRTVDGQPIERRVAARPGEIVSCDMIACVWPMLSRVQGLGVGERSRMDVRMLEATVGSLGEASGNPVFFAETWEWLRTADEDGARSYEVTVNRRGVEWTLRVIADATGVRELDSRGTRRHVTRRERS